VIGGLFSVRGYPQSEATGDTVLIGSLEYRYYLARSLPISRKPVRLPFLGSVRVTPQQVYGRADWDLMLRAFADAGRSFRNRRAQPLGPSERDETLVGAGVGIELQLGSQLRARLDWARSLKAVGAGAGRVDSGNDEFHLMVNLLY
jgi:hemolysin activation/secretion protein